MEQVIIFSLGASLASFLGLVIQRFPQQSIVSPRSYCDHCQHQLAWHDLIPILSQLSSRFRCRYCQAKIPSWYALWEASLGGLFLLAHFQLLTYWQAYLLIFSLTLAIYDLKTRSFPLMVWLVFNLPLIAAFGFNGRAAILLTLALLTEHYDINLGSGDLCYLASLSLVINLIDLLWTIQIGCLSALIYALWQVRQRPQSPIPLVPFLLLGYLWVLMT